MRMKDLGTSGHPYILSTLQQQQQSGLCMTTLDIHLHLVECLMCADA